AGGRAARGGGRAGAVCGAPAGGGGRGPAAGRTAGPGGKAGSHEGHPQNPVPPRLPGGRAAQRQDLPREAGGLGGAAAGVRGGGAVAAKRTDRVGELIREYGQLRARAPRDTWRKVEILMYGLSLVKDRRVKPLYLDILGDAEEYDLARIEVMKSLGWK